jgi:hypothetical protein
MPHVYQIAYALAVILTCGFTYWAGGRTERIGLGIVIVASLASYPATVLIHPRWREEMLGAAAIDGLTTIAFFILMVRSRAYWPIWSLGFCLAMMAAHAMRWIQHAIPAWSYYDTTSLWAYPVLAAIVVGAASHRWGRQTESF